MIIHTISFYRKSVNHFCHALQSFESQVFLKCIQLLNIYTRGNIEIGKNSLLNENNIQNLGFASELI